MSCSGWHQHCRFQGHQISLSNQCIWWRSCWVLSINIQQTILIMNNIKLERLSDLLNPTSKNIFLVIYRQKHWIKTLACKVWDLVSFSIIIRYYISSWVWWWGLWECVQERASHISVLMDTYWIITNVLCSSHININSKSCFPPHISHWSSMLTIHW